MRRKVKDFPVYWPKKSFTLWFRPLPVGQLNLLRKLAYAAK
jgi:hypothetical protein